MQSVKLSVTCGKLLAKKYNPKALTTIGAAIKRWIAADQARGIRNIYVELDDRAAMKVLKVSALQGKVTPQKVKQVIDALVVRLSPDYIVLIGADDVVPSFEVPNPTLNPTGDTDTGQLYYGASHQTDSTARGKKKMHAATAWELHPVTGIRYLGHPTP